MGAGIQSRQVRIREILAKRTAAHTRPSASLGRRAGAGNLRGLLSICVLASCLGGQSDTVLEDHRVRGAEGSGLSHVSSTGTRSVGSGRSPFPMERISGESVER